MLSDIRTLTSYDVVLTPTNAEAAELNRELALAGGALSSLVCSIASWTGRLWELAGNGRRFVDGLTRIVAMAIALDGRDGLSGPHLPSLLAQRVRDAAGTPQLDAALNTVRTGASPEGLLPAEVEVLRALAAYEDELDTLGIIEEGSALAYLTEHLNETFPQILRVGVIGETPLDPRFEGLLDAAAAAGRIERSFLGHLSGKAGAELAPAPQATTLRFAFPSGRYATPQLVLNVVDELIQDGHVLISCKKPYQLYKLLEPVLAARGLTAAVRGDVRLAETLLGRLFFALAHAWESADPPWDKAALTDALANPLAHVDAQTLSRFDVILRENRLLTGDEALNQAPAREFVEALAAFMRTPSSATLAAVKSALAQNAMLGPAERGELYAMLEVFEGILSTHQALGRPIDSLAYLLSGPLGASGFNVRYANTQLELGEWPDVLIEGMAQAAAEPRTAFASVVVLDLDAESYPAAKKYGAIDLLMERLGVPGPETPIERQRRQLAALTKMPTHTIVLGRCLTNAKSDPTYPAAVLEEFVDLYRADVTLADDIDNVYALPEELQAGLITCGEDALEADVWPGMRKLTVRPARKTPKASLVFPHPSEYDWPQDDDYSLEAEDEAEAKLVAALRLSPGQIESFLDCPAKWLYASRLGVGSLDEEMGARELGIFRHDSLQRFYERFREKGQMKVTRNNLKLAQEVLKEAMAEVRAGYRELDEHGRPAHKLNRCVAPSNSSDGRTIERVERELLEWLPFEASFLPGPATGEGTSPSAYVPRAFELSLDDYDVTFAGARLIGRIDRVDVSLDGSSFVVVDYKGHVGPNYVPVLEGTEVVLPTKLQALIYAAAIARTPALQEALGITQGGIEAIAGALYVSYLRGHAIRGTFTERLTRERHLPTVPPKAQPCTSEELRELIEAVEKTVADNVVHPIVNGWVDPEPLPNACTYCPAEGCPVRGWADAS